jgi:TonB family protein
MRAPFWDILQLEQTRDRSEIRRAYARRLKDTNPEDDPTGFQALRAAYEQALFHADQAAYWANEADSAPDTETWVAPEPSPAAEDYAPPPPISRSETPPPQFDVTGHWADVGVLDHALQADTAPQDLAARLAAILNSPAMDNIGVYAATETSLSQLLARRSPRSDPLLQTASDYFAWRQVSLHGDRSRERQFILERLGVLEQLEKLKDPTYTDHGAYLALMGPPPKKRTRREAALASSMRRLFRLVQSEAPGLVNHFNPETRTWWRDYLNSEAPRRWGESSGGGWFTSGRIWLVIFAVVSVGALGRCIGDLDIQPGSAPAPPVAEYPVAPTADGPFSGPVLVKAPSAAIAAELYPGPARRQGLSGFGIVGCSVTQTGEAEDCVVQNESPAGAGFGAAAVAYIEQSRFRPGERNGHAVDTTLSMSVRFSPGPGGGDPIVVAGAPPPMVVARLPNQTPSLVNFTEPELVGRPSHGQFEALYPARASQKGISGMGQVSCVISEQGRAQDCVIKKESPAGYGFGRATIAYLQESTFKPARAGDKPVGGVRITMTVTFTSGGPRPAPGPAAPPASGPDTVAAPQALQPPKDLNYLPRKQERIVQPLSAPPQ